MRTVIISVLVVLLVGGVSVYFAMSDKGAINVNQKITDTNQSGFKEQVLPNTQSEAPNGGLHAGGGNEAPQAPPPPPPETASTTATTTVATTTPTATSSKP